MKDDDLQRIKAMLRLTCRHATSMTGAELRQARENAGLSLGQAARFLEINRVNLERLERDAEPGVVSIAPDTGAQLDALYGLGKKLQPEARRLLGFDQSTDSE